MRRTISAGEIQTGSMIQNMPNCTVSEVPHPPQYTEDDPAYTPSPSILTVSIDPLGDESANESVHNIRQVDCAIDKCSPLQRGDVGNDKTVD
jgi:hypothetical protein